MIQLPPAKAYIFDMDGTLTDNMHFHHDIQDNFNRKGLISEKGEKKMAFYVLQQYYNQK